jgi:hypothetical protein
MAKAKKPLTEAEVDDVVARYGRGQSLGFIQFALGRDRQTLKAALVSRGIKIRVGRQPAMTITPRRRSAA